MADNILESYLVKLGAVTDANSFNKFNATLKDSTKIVGDFSLSTIANFGKLEVAIVGMFGAVGAGIIGLADKTAMADQSYRLMGLRMLMGKDSARAMSMATDELGASLDEIAYDPELNRRFQALYEQNIKLGKSLGTGVGASMMGIRDLRMEYKMFETELEFLTIGAVSKLFEKLGFGSGDALNELDKLNQWFSENVPKWADDISTRLVPVWDDSVIVVKQFGKGLETAAGDFTMLSGVLLGDKSIQSTTFNVNNLATAIGDWANRLTELALAQTLVAKTGSHYFDAVTNVAGAGLLKLQIMAEKKDAHPNEARIAALTKQYNDAMSQANKNATQFTDTLHGAFTGQYDGNADFEDFDNYLNHKPSANGAPNHSDRDPSPVTDTFTHDSKATAATIAKLAQKVSADTGISADLIFAQWEFETGKFTSEQTKKLNNLGGIKIPGTDVFKKFESLDKYADAYEKLISSPRYVNNGINDAKTPEAFAHSLKTTSGIYYGRGPHGEDIENQYAAGLRQYQPDLRDYAQAGTRGGSGDITVTIQSITVPPNTHPDDIKRYITDSMVDYTDKVNQRTMSETAAGWAH